ncbi:hypothetical protein ACLMJK_003851 [Lecanora helva]
MIFAHRGSSLPLIYFAVACATTVAGAVLPILSNVTSTLSGKAKCFSQDLNVDVVSNNLKILLDPPANQTVVTETLVELLQNGSTLFSRVNGGQNIIKKTYRIYGKLCVPQDASTTNPPQIIQFLTHGDTFDSTYWDLSPGYSYIDLVISQGQATFSYDRIGVGRSQHPDPLQEVQAPLQVEIAHALVTLIRKAQVGPYSFNIVVGVGHGAGSTINPGVTTKYPRDFDSVILTGTSVSTSFVNTTIASSDLTIANTDSSGRFAGLPNGYLVQPLPQSIQFPYLRWPNFDPKILKVMVDNKQIQTLGELLTLDTIAAPSTQFRGFVFVILGENDLVSCGGDCTQPQDQAALVAPTLYPTAFLSRHSIISGAGHALFAHYAFLEAFAVVNDFLRSNRF